MAKTANVKHEFVVQTKKKILKYLLFFIDDDYFVMILIYKFSNCYHVNQLINSQFHNNSIIIDVYFIFIIFRKGFLFRITFKNKNKHVQQEIEVNKIMFDYQYFKIVNTMLSV